MSFWSKLTASSKKIWAQRAPRLRVTGQDKLEVFLKTPDDSTPLKMTVQNISSGGLGMYRSERPKVVIGDAVSVTLKIFASAKEWPFQLEGKVAHLNEKFFGIQFSSANSDLGIALDQCFRIENLGALLRTVDPKYLKIEEGTVPLWLTDSAGNEVYVLQGPTGVLSFHMSFDTHYVEGAVGKTTKIGKIAKGPTGRINKGSDVIETSTEDRGKVLTLARDYVANANGLSEASLTQVIALLK